MGINFERLAIKMYKCARCKEPMRTDINTGETQCEKCGAFIITNWRVCPYCGSPIEDEDEDEEDEDDE